MVPKPKQSKHFSSLNKNLSKIGKIFLSMKNRSNGAYTVQEQTNARAYGLLAHAEIEHYFEAVAKEVVQNAYKKWKSDKKPSHVLMSVATFMNIKKEFPSRVRKVDLANNKNGLIETRYELHVSKYIKILVDNNGIKETNLLKILLPLGIHLDEIDSTFLNSIDSFGTDRGEIAHNSIKTKILIDPFTKEKDVNNILTEIRKLDTKLIYLK